MEGRVCFTHPPPFPPPHPGHCTSRESGPRTPFGEVKVNLTICNLSNWFAKDLLDCWNSEVAILWSCRNWWIKDQQTHHSFSVLVLNILLHVSAFQNVVIRESDMGMLRWCPMSWKTGWELYIVTDGVIVGYMFTIYSSHPSLFFTTLDTISACSYWTPWLWHFEMPKRIGVY
jgi:hypothetical protein